MAAALLLSSKSALAYRTIADLPDFAGSDRVRWRGGVYEFYVYGKVPEWLPIGALTTGAQRAVTAWTEPTCSAVLVSYVGLTDSPAALGDGRSTIEVIVEGWEELGYQPKALGVTSLEFEATENGDWEIVEADIRLNAEHHEWSLSDAPSDGRRSLLGTLRHEGGHALGLLHPCEESGEDNAPPCNATAPNSTIMYPFYEPGQTELTPDDVAGICSLYPTCELEGCDAGFVCSEGACLSECGEGVCELSEICVDGACLSQEECEGSGCFMPPPAWIIGCAPDDSCPAGLCLSDGSCAQQCGRDDDCSHGRPCVFDENPNVPGYCGLIPLKKLGEECSSPLECEDGECLAGAESRSVCTRTCAAGHPPCPSGWSCSSVEGRASCVPPRVPRGCAVSPHVHSMPVEDATSWPLLVAFPLALFAARRRRPRVQVRSVHS